MRSYWLVKSEPDVHSFAYHQSLPGGVSTWDGVRNYQARNYMRDGMRLGDRVLFYHSNTEPPHIAGLCEVVREAYPDPTAWDPSSAYFDPKCPPGNPRWLMVDLRALCPVARVVSLDELRSNPALHSMRLVQRGNRLSVMPVTEDEYLEILRMAETPDPA
jgi:predicted RNA-binding protein with PUA-like domain